MPLTLEQIEARLADHHPPYPAPGRRAAVAAVFRFDLGRPEVLLMKRSERAGDRWSGHVSFPGGREEAGDPDLLATAVRETLEEVGLDLRRSARLLGRLGATRAVARGRVLPMTITPFVFNLVADAPLALREEAESAFWFPLDRAAAGALDDTYTYRLGPIPLNLPCWRYEGYVVWGLTYQMLRGLLAVVGG
ncbi:MAG TPA: CoA pyrophosphatase [Haliangiales bacterium]|nr:CoA pyrophosphatase [Haliangiales bacterium]